MTNYEREKDDNITSEKQVVDTVTVNMLNSEGRDIMKRYVKKVTMAVLFVTILSVGMLSGALDVWAQDRDGTFAKQIQGSWILVSCINEQNGKKVDLFGSNPKGSMILTPNGRFSIIIMRSSLPKFASNSRTKGTAEDNQAVVQGSIAFFGSYRVTNEKEQTVKLRIEGSTFPNWAGAEQERSVTVIGDEMKYTNSSPAIGSGTNYLVWRRVK